MHGRGAKSSCRALPESLKDVPDLDDDGTIMTVLLCGTSHASAPVAGALADSVGFDDMPARRQLEEVSYRVDISARLPT